MNENTSDIYAAMQTGKPFKVYKKVILGKVYLRVLDEFSDKPKGVHLEGNPAKNQEGCFFKTWNERQDMFLRNMNKEHFKNGTIVEIKQKDIKVPVDKKKPYSEYTEEEVEAIALSRYFTLEKTLNESDSEAFIIRILAKAQELERPDKTIKAIEARLSELQSLELSDGDTDHN